MTRLLVAQSLPSEVGDWKEGASLSAELSATGGFLWLVFRLLVGRAMADAMRDISILKVDYESLKEQLNRLEEAQNRKEDKLDRLIERLAESRA